MGWVGFALLFNAIWIMTSLSQGRPVYYWPMWPLFFMGLPLVMSLFANRSPQQPNQNQPSQNQPRQNQHRLDQPRQLPPGDDLR